MRIISLKGVVSLFIIGREKSSRVLSNYRRKVLFGLVKLTYFQRFYRQLLVFLPYRHVSKLSSLNHDVLYRASDMETKNFFWTSMEVFEVEIVQLLLVLAESASIKSTSTTSSRPPTPFARPITAPVMARPKTTTIRFFIINMDEFDDTRTHNDNKISCQPSHSERAELGLEGEEGEEADEMLDENLETLHPNKMRRTHSRNGDLLGDQVWIH